MTMIKFRIFAPEDIFITIRLQSVPLFIEVVFYLTGIERRRFLFDYE